MSQDVGVKINTDGLIFSYDVNNEKSYIGPPIQNIATTITPQGSYSYPGIAYTAGTEIVNIPTLGTMSVPYMEGYNSNSANYCCLNQFYFVNGNGYVAGTGATTYTYSIVYRCTSGYTSANYMYRYEHDSAGNYLGEAGVHDDAKRIHLGDGWYWAWNTFTSNTAMSRIYLRNFYYQYNVLDRLSIAKVLVTPGDYTELPPRLWPAVGTTRTESQTVIDQTRRSTVTTSNLTYTSNSAFNFVGSSDSSTINIPLSTSFNKLAGTIGMWVNPTSYSGSNGLFVNRDNNTPNAFDWFWMGSWNSGSIFYFRLGDGTTCCSNDLTISSWSTLCPVNTWSYVTCSWLSGGESRIYVNGVLRASRTISSIPATNPSTTGKIGLGHNAPGCWNGKIGITQIYNRQLSDAEILANYNAMKGRYGL